MSDPATVGLGSKSATYWGITWGVAVGIVEYLAIAPVDDWGSLQQLIFWLLYWLMPFWCEVGCVFVWLADRHARMAHRARFERYVATVQETQPPWSNSIPNWSNWSTLALYLVWVPLLYGGLLVAARLFTVRMERTRHLLYHSAMARSRTEALLDSARLEALQSQIDPKLLLDSLQNLEQRYRASPAGAERLLEALVEFLRFAMHGLRVPVSTLHAELQLAHAFANLQHERGVDGAWRIVEESAPPHTLCKFPSLLMLRLLALGGDGGDGGRPMLRVRQESGQTVLSMHGVSRSVSTELQQQIKTRMYALYGERFLFEAHLPHLPSLRQLRITLMSPSSSGESHA
jgi:hypothetical protein